MDRDDFHLCLQDDGTVTDVTREACILTGLPERELLQRPLTEHFLPEHRLRFENELEALVAGDEQIGRVHCTVLGLDGIGRRLNLRMSPLDEGGVHVDLELRKRGNEPSAVRVAGGHHRLSESGRLLPVARRILAAARRGKSRSEVLRGGLEVLAEVTEARAGAALQWSGTRATSNLEATLGEFDERALDGVFRAAVIGRLTRGDVIIKELDAQGGSPDESLLLVPLIAGEVPEAVIALEVTGYTVLASIEHQSLGAFGEVLGLGLRALEAGGASRGRERRGADVEAAVALGRLSVGLAHEIKNAATVLRNDVDQLASRARGSGQTELAAAAVRDSVEAVETIRNLTDALCSFAPEKTGEPEEVDLVRVLEMVVASVRFHAERGLRLSLRHPGEGIPSVRCHSHYLIRSLFLVLVELADSAREAGGELDVVMELGVASKDVVLRIGFSHGPVGTPALLLSQLEPGGVLNRHISRSGARLEHEIAGEHLELSVLIPAADARRRSPIPRSPRAAAPSRRGTILVVDSEEAVIRSTRRVLEGEHDVLAARSSEEALRMLEANPELDVLLLDALLPQAGGMDLRDQIASKRPDLAGRIVLVGPGPAIAERVAHPDGVANETIAKPIDIEALKSLISRMVG
ncbi:MAG: response regulator [Polyangia bacterium]